MNLDLLGAAMVLAIHFLFILWVLSGWLFTRRRPPWRWLHIASLIYGIFIEASDLTCPLTFAETYLEERGGITPYHEPFILHYLELLVYPEIPANLLTAGAVALCAGILLVYVARYRRRDARGW